MTYHEETARIRGQDKEIDIEWSGVCAGLEGKPWTSVPFLKAENPKEHKLWIDGCQYGENDRLKRGDEPRFTEKWRGYKLLRGAGGDLIHAVPYHCFDIADYLDGGLPKAACGYQPRNSPGSSMKRAKWYNRRDGYPALTCQKCKAVRLRQML